MISANSVSTRRHNIGTLYLVTLLREELGRRIATARHEAALTQRELADLIRLKNASDVSRYERGEVDVPSHRIDLIAQATGKPRSYFTRDPSEPQPADPDRLDRLESLIEQVLDLVRAVHGELADQRATQPAQPREGSRAR